MIKGGGGCDNDIWSSCIKFWYSYSGSQEDTGFIGGDD